MSWAEKEQWLLDSGGYELSFSFCQSPKVGTVFKYSFSCTLICSRIGASCLWRGSQWKGEWGAVDSPVVSGMCVSHDVAVTGAMGDSWMVLPLEDSPVGDVWELLNLGLHRRLDKLVTVYCQTWLVPKTQFHPEISMWFLKLRRWEKEPRGGCCLVMHCINTLCRLRDQMPAIKARMLPKSVAVQLA